MIESNVQSLPQEKIKNGYQYNLVTRSTSAAMYQQIVQKDCNGIVGETVGFEVFQILIGKPYSLVQKHGNKKGEVYNYPAMEKFPGNENFGIWAWAYNSKETAMEKFNSLNKGIV